MFVLSPHPWYYLLCATAAGGFLGSAAQPVGGLVDLIWWQFAEYARQRAREIPGEQVGAS